MQGQSLAEEEQRDHQLGEPQLSMTLQGFVSLDFRATGKAGRALQSSCW